MWTAGIVVLIGTWWMTGNIVFACCLAGGYYAVALALGFVFRRILSPVWLRISVQILIAACLVAGLFYIGSSNVNKTANPALREKTTLDAHDKDEKVRDFALREAPSAWKAYQVLTEAVEEQDRKISELRATLKMFGSNVDEDADIRKLSQMRDELAGSRDTVKVKLEAAYLQSRKFAASPDSKEYDELRKQAIEDGVNEARSALQRYKALKVH